MDVLNFKYVAEFEKHCSVTSTCWVLTAGLEALRFIFSSYGSEEKHQIL